MEFVVQELRLVGVSEDGANLLLADGDGGRYSVAISDELRVTIRRDRREPSSADGQAKQENPLRPRDVQGLIRAGVPLEEIAERAGWSLEKVQRYEGPIRAERDYVSELAQRVQLSGRGESTTLRERADRRLAERGVEAERVIWDSWKNDDTHWTVVVRFPAGGRQREATWVFDPVNRALRTVDDEARWLGGDEIPAADETSGGVDAPTGRPTQARAHRDAPVYDVEAEGGIAEAQDAHLGARMGAPGPRAGGGDLTAAMRARQASRGRARTTGAPKPATGKAAGHAAQLPGRMAPVAPVERIDVGGTPPPAPSHPRPDDFSDGSDVPPTSEPPTSEPAWPDDAEHTPTRGERSERSAPQKGSARAPEASDAGPVVTSTTSDDTAASTAEASSEGHGESARESSRRRKTRRPRARVEPVSVRSAIRPDDEAEQQDESLFGELPGFHDGGDETEHEDSPRHTDAADVDAHDSGAADDDDVDAQGSDEAFATDEGDHTASDAADDDVEPDGDDHDDSDGASGAEKTKRAGSPSATRDVPSRASQSRKSSRPSVPSWDDIMFGGRGSRR